MTHTENAQRYHNAAHAVQSGIAMKLERDPTFGTPKDLRVGIDTTKADLGSLVTLLIAKGVFTHAEYLAALADGMEREKELWESILSEDFGTEVRLA